VTRPLTAADVLVVFDTNALLPLLVGKTRRALFLRQAWQDKRFILAVTPLIIEELSLANSSLRPSGKPFACQASCCSNILATPARWPARRSP
jgi:hypothetical protein